MNGYNREESSRKTDASLEWNSIILKEMSPSVPVSLSGNGLNMFKLTLTLTPVADDGTGARPSVYVSPQVLRDAITLLDYNQSQITPITYLPTVPTIDNMPEFTGWAYTDEPNDFILSTFDANVSTANNADYDPNQQTVTFYVLCKTATASDIRIGYRIKPTSGADIIDTINGTNGFTGHYVQAIASAETYYTYDDLQALPSYQTHYGDSDEFQISTDVNDGNYWRQINYEIVIKGYSGQIYYRLSKQNLKNVSYLPIAMAVLNGYATQLFMWNQNDASNVTTYIRGVGDKQIFIGHNPGNNSNIRIVLLFSIAVNLPEVIQYDNKCEVTFYDSTGKSGKFSIDSELPNYAQLRSQPQNINSWNPVVQAHGEIWGKDGCLIANYNIISPKNRYLAVDTNAVDIFLDTNPPTITNNCQWHTQFTTNKIGEFTISTIDKSKFIYVYYGSNIITNELVMELLDKNTYGDQAMFFTIHPAWLEQAYFITKNDKSGYLIEDASTNPHTGGLFIAVAPYNNNNQPNIKNMLWTFIPNT